MALQYSFPASLIVVLIFSVFPISHAHNSPSFLDFLKNMNGTHKGDVVRGVGELKKYLRNLGYMSTPSSQDDAFDDVLESAIKKYQNFFRLKITGSLDQETLKLLSRSRCGVADFPNGKYEFLGSKWPRGKRNLTVAYNAGTREDAFDPFFVSFFKWCLISPFNFYDAKSYAQADVKISFLKRDHGDGFPFDGPGGVLAHSYPPTNGRMHLDAEENWITEKETGGDTDLKTIALHEIGHILGLAHSDDPNAIMFPSFEYRQVKELNADDVRGIQALYPSG